MDYSICQEEELDVQKELLSANNSSSEDDAE
jgi:hypothetical protein